MKHFKHLRRLPIKFLATASYLLISIQVIASSDCLEKFNLHNSLDMQISRKDTASAIVIFEAMKQTNCYLENWLHNNASDMYFSLGDVRSAKEELSTAIQKGYLNLLIADNDEEKYLKKWTRRFGAEFCKELIDVSLKLQENLLKDNYKILQELTEIFSIDQGLRKNKMMRRAEGIGYRKRYGFEYQDSLIDQALASRLYDDWLIADSINLQNFVNICLELGHIPDSRLLQGFVPIFVLVIHSANFDFPESYQKIVLNSVSNNYISPHYYGWYLGFHNEYAKKPHELYYTVSKEELEAMSIKEIEIIDKRRAEIGLKLCPSTVWNPNVRE